MNATATLNNHNRRTNPAVFLFILVALFGIGTLAIPRPEVAQSIKPPTILENTHADVVHGVVAEQARNACKQYGVSQIYLQKDNNRFHFLCHVPGMGWFDWIVEKFDNAWHETTAFQPKDGTISTVTRWIKAKPVKWIPLEVFEKTFR